MTDDAAPGAPAAALAQERAQAVALFNHAWSLLDLPERSAAQEFDLIHCSHASRWHWGRAGGPQEWAIGEWQCARTYAVLGRPEPALVHAQRCLDLCAEHDLAGFIVASAIGFSFIAGSSAFAGCGWGMRTGMLASRGCLVDKPHNMRSSYSSMVSNRVIAPITGNASAAIIS